MAYTGNPPVTEVGTQVSFCDLFWEQRFMSSVTAGPAKTPADLGSLSLISFEQALIHEWMHCDVMGFKSHSKCESKINPYISCNSELY
jgi:hypothetical protein